VQWRLGFFLPVSEAELVFQDSVIFSKYSHMKERATGVKKLDLHVGFTFRPK
jgi:hypothetical protein